MRWLSVSSFALALLLARPVLACGGGFGYELEIEPSQTIVLAHDENAGVESYLFNPSFCGPAADFGLIVPIPGPLVADPSEEAHVEEALEDIAQPEVRVVEECARGSDGAVGSAGGFAGAGMGGIDIVSEGSVGIFDWVQLTADSAAAFTDWLDERSFPYESQAMAAFQHYVDAGWQFLAFTVKAGEGAGSADRICGDFGPLRLDFEASAPVVPARIAAADALSLETEFVWRVFVVADERLRIAGVEELDTGEGEASGGGGVATGGGAGGLTHLYQELRYAGQLSADDLAAEGPTAALAGDSTWLEEMGSEGRWLTELRVTFGGAGLNDDLTLEASPEQAPFRRVVLDYETVECDGSGSPLGTGSAGTGEAAASDSSSGGSSGGCTVTPGRTADLAWWALPALLLWRARRRRRAGG